MGKKRGKSIFFLKKRVITNKKLKRHCKMKSNEKGAAHFCAINVNVVVIKPTIPIQLSLLVVVGSNGVQKLVFWALNTVVLKPNLIRFIVAGSN